MQRHDRDGACLVVDLVSRGEQRDRGEKVDESAVGGSDSKLLGLPDEFFEVLGAGRILSIAAVLQ